MVFMLHVVFVYWWYRNTDLLYPLALLPQKEIPPFWHALFIITVNGMYTPTDHPKITYPIQSKSIHGMDPAINTKTLHCFKA